MSSNYYRSHICDRWQHNACYRCWMGLTFVMAAVTVVTVWGRQTSQHGMMLPAESVFLLENSVILTPDSQWSAGSINDPFLWSEQGWKFHVSTISIFWVTLAVFPAVTALIRSSNADSGSALTTTLFVPLACFVTFNFTDLFGRLLARFLPIVSTYDSFLPKNLFTSPYLVHKRSTYRSMLIVQLWSTNRTGRCFPCGNLHQFSIYFSHSVNTAEVKPWPLCFYWLFLQSSTNANWLLMMAVGRVVFVPLLIVCNVAPTSRVLTNVIFQHDWQYIIIMVLFGLSNGYITTLALTYASKWECFSPSYDRMFD